MKIFILIKEQPEHDRVVYVFLNDKRQIVGLNFHQGVNYAKDIDTNIVFSNIDEKLTNVFFKLEQIKDVNQRINESIEIYNQNHL
jgi:hypothetical protein